ncbi:MAG TPA: HDOD domain-containing protein [Opitutaceae bacterium]
MIAAPVSRTQLPALVEGFSAAPRILAELNRLLRRFFPSVDDVTALLRRDSSLVTRILKMANSAQFAGAEPASSIEEAVARIGLREVHRLVGIAAIAPPNLDGLPLYAITSRRFREHSLMTALIMEELAKRVDEDAPTCYVIGLLRPLGRLALDRLARGLPPAPAFDPGPNSPVNAWESERFGLTNLDAATVILEAWNFPSEAITAISSHYQPGGKHLPLIHMLNLAAGATEFLGLGLPGETIFWESNQDSYAKAGTSPREMPLVIERAQRSFAKLAGALD